ncbi:ABC transporter [Deltaproteobacteria bacterium]|nr:ABC transporter [Deltaproteobacteria bacterium]
MVGYLAKRLLAVSLTLAAASVLIFAVTQLLPGDVAQMILGEHATPESVAVIRAKLGLDAPWPVRYGKWIGGALRGDLGESLMAQGVPVGAQIYNNAKASLFLAGLAAAAVIPLALLLGCLSGLKPDSWLDRLISLAAMISISLPEFVSGIFLIIIFSLKLGWLPAASLIDTSQSLWGQWRYLVLPIATLALVLLGYIARMTRASVIETAGQPYIRAAQLKGLPLRRVIMGHLLRNALLPTVTIIAMNIGWLVGGLVVVETVFSYPGLGALLITGITQRDVPLIQGTALLIVTVYMFLNFLADVAYRLLNPRLRSA